MNFINFITLMVIFTCSISEAHANKLAELEACKTIKIEKQHVAYLLNSDGSISKGPIDYGKWIDDGKSEEVLIPTQYKLLVFPARTEIVNNDCFQYGCLKLIKSKQLCKGVATYDVMVRLIFRRKNTYYQYADDTEFVPIEIFDPKEDYPSELIYRFIPRIKGFVYKPDQIIRK